MNELVFLKNNQALTTSLKVAEYFERRHDRVLRAISASIQALPKIGDSDKAFIKSSYTDESGKSNPMYLLNRDGFMFVVMGFTGKKAAELKWNYIQAFNAMEQKLIALLAERKSAEWLAVREAAKNGNKRMAAVVHEFLLPTAQAQGYDKPERFLHINYNRAINRAACVNPKSRDEQPLGQLYEIEKMQSMVEVAIKGATARGDHFKQIYRDVDQMLENYSRLSFIPQRFLVS